MKIYFVFVLLLFNCYSNKDLNPVFSNEPIKAIWVRSDEDVFEGMIYNDFNTIYIMYYGKEYENNTNKAIELAKKDNLDIFICLMVFHDMDTSFDNRNKIKGLVKQFCKKDHIKGIILDYIRFKDIKIFDSERRKKFISDFALEIHNIVKEHKKDFKLTMIPYFSFLYGQDKNFFRSVADKVLPMLYPADIPLLFKTSIIRNTLKKSTKLNYEPCLQAFGDRKYEELLEDIKCCNESGFSVFRLKTYLEIKNKMR